jgi:hypothetical protein
VREHLLQTQRVQRLPLILGAAAVEVGQMRLAVAAVEGEVLVDTLKEL